MMAQGEVTRGADFASVRNEAVTFRGRVMHEFANLEFEVGEVVARASALPDYAALKPKIPHMIGQKLERLRRLLSEPGPIQSHGDKVLPLVEAVARHEELRRFMAHGQLETAMTERGEFLLLFQMIRPQAGGARIGVFRVARKETGALVGRLSRDVAALITALAELRAGALKGAPALECDPVLS